MYGPEKDLPERVLAPGEEDELVDEVPSEPKDYPGPIPHDVEEP